MIFGNLDAKRFKYRDVVLRVGGWQNRVRQGIERLLPAIFVLPVHPGRDQRIGWSFRNWFTGSDPVNRLHQVPS
jgi:hypothetical protein